MYGHLIAFRASMTASGELGDHRPHDRTTGMRLHHIGHKVMHTFKRHKKAFLAALPISAIALAIGASVAAQFSGF